MLNSWAIGITDGDSLAFFYRSMGERFDIGPARKLRAQPVTLLRIEDVKVTKNGYFDFVAGFAVFGLPLFPECHHAGALALAHLTAKRLRLLIRNPPRRLITVQLGRNKE